MCDQPINVVVRLRPPLEGETLVTSENLKLNIDEKTVIVKQQYNSFNCVFDGTSTNKLIYEEIVKPNIKKLLEGYNVTILAYGSTGSGKTYTMGTNVKSSDDADQGLIPLGLSDIFSAIKPVILKCDVTLTASFFEIYLEEIRDLLNPENSNLLIRGEAQDLKILNLTEITIGSVDEALELLKKGSSARHSESTAKNVLSSRSHAIFMVQLTISDRATGLTIKSKFQLVDLAGSERTKTSKTEGQQFKQGLSINKALSTLARVIISITNKEKHIPYRDSNLTRILQDSLGGNTFTVMIGCISPSSSSFEETLNTLRYVSLAGCIKNKPVIFVDAKDAQIEKLLKQLKAYEEELKKYRKEKSLINTEVLSETFIVTSEKELNELDKEANVNESQVVTPVTSVLQSCDIEERENEFVLKQIENLNRDLESKEKDLESCKLFFEVLKAPHDINDINQLFTEKIKEMQAEKAALVEQFKKENEDKVAKLEENIKILQQQLKTKESLEVFKYSVTKREEFLKNEIKNLKTSKVELIKKMKEETKIQKKIVIEDNKKIAALEKQFRNTEVKWKKKETSLENKIKILEKKVTNAQVVQKSKKFPLKSKEKQDSKDLSKDMLNLINEDIALEKMKAEVEFYEDEAETLKEQIENEEKDASEIYEQNMNELNKKIKEMRKTLKDHFNGTEERFNYVNNLKDGKAALKILIHQIKICEKEKMKLSNLLEKTSSSLESSEGSLEKLFKENIDLTKEIEEFKSKETAKTKKARSKNSSPNKNAAADTEIVVYLEDGDESFASTSDLNDPDFRATPMHKRKLKRKISETALIDDDDEIPAKKTSHGCSCPSNCVSIRCACRKKSHVCGKFCKCDKTICLNVASTSKKN